MKSITKLIGVPVLAVVLSSAVSLVYADPDVDEDLNFTDSDTPKTTVFNLRVPSDNRHIDRFDGEPAPEPAEPAPVVDCDPGTVTDYVDLYLARLEKSAPAQIAVGTPLTYNYTVTAKDKVKKVVVEETIPEGATYVSSSPEAEVSGSNVVWTLYNLGGGETVALSLTVQPSGMADLHSCATMEVFPEACTTTTVGVPELAIVKTTPNEQVLIGSGVPWNITVTNTGNFCAYDVVVTDTLPAGVSHDSGSGVLKSEIGTLAPGESREISVNTTATAPGEHCNVAQVDSSNANSAEDDACIVVVEAGLEVVKEGPPMQFVDKRASYTITATNTGDITITDVVVTDTVPAEYEIVSAPGGDIAGNTVTWVTTLGGGESQSFGIDIIGRRDGTYCNQVAVASDEFGLSDSDEACTEWRGYPALLIEVIDTEDPLLIGEETTYVIKITNQGTAPDTNVTLSATVADNFEVVSAAGDTQGRISGRSISFAPYGTLAAKEVIEFQIVARALDEGDGRFNAQMNSDLLQTPVPEEESTQVY